MKKFFGFIFALIAFVLMVVGLTVPTTEVVLHFADPAIVKVEWLYSTLNWLVSNGPWVMYGIIAGVWAVLIIVGALINYRLGKAGYFLSFLFALGAYGALLYFVKWGAWQGDHVFLSEVVTFPWLTRDIALYVGAGVVALGCIFSIFARMLFRKANKNKARKAARKVIAAADVPPRKDTDLAYTTSRTSDKREVYVRDPWGNFIRQEDYDERVSRSKGQKF